MEKALCKFTYMRAAVNSITYARVKLKYINRYHSVSPNTVVAVLRVIFLVFMHIRVPTTIDIKHGGPVGDPMILCRLGMLCCEYAEFVLFKYLRNLISGARHVA